MKALFSRFKSSNGSVPQRDRDMPPLATLPPWPPPVQKPATPPAMSEVKSLPPITIDIGLHSTPASPTAKTSQHVQQSTSSTTATAVSTSESASASTSASPQPKKAVTFVSPPQSATGLESSGAYSPTGATDPKRGNASFDIAAHSGHRSASNGRTSSSAGPLGSKASLATSARAHSTSLRPAAASPSLRSGSPYSQTSTRTAVPMVQSWSEGAEGDLVANLGQRERTRQEVLWEIVASEERYVLELVKLKEVFIEPLLHPYSAQSPTFAGSPDPDMDYFGRDPTPRESESHEHLPIASRFISSRSASVTDPSGNTPQPQHLRTETPMIDGESLDTEEDEASEAARARSMEAAKHNHPRSPYGTAVRAAQQRKKMPSVPFPTRSHQSLPPPPRQPPPGTSTASLGRQNGGPHNGSGQRLDSAAKSTTSPSSRVLRKLQKKPSSSAAAGNGAIPPHLLPEDLRRCLEVLETGIIPGHHILSEGLRKRYDEQYPLVRSLADVFVTNSHILAEYATFVLHLERALEQVDNALTQANNPGKKPKNQDAADWIRFCAHLQTLEDHAAERSETGLAISLSKPFQRLLKYPLLFQNLLFHTDPSTFEYESTLLMVSEVETIVRSIEDEKILQEDRDKTRDIFARIEGLDKVKMLALPKPSRILVDERLLPPESFGDLKSSGPPPSRSSKSSFKRLSEVLQPGSSSGVGGKRDLWLVSFNDVVLRCQRTATTTLPIASSSSASGPGAPVSRTNSMPELQGKAKYANRRASAGKPRNLYKFIKIETWDIGEVAKPRAGVVDMNDITRTRAISNAGPGTDVPIATPEEDEDAAMESDDSDRKSKMSFSYWGADRVTLSVPRTKLGVPITKNKSGSASLASGAGRRAQIPSSYTNRESGAAAKFGTRLVDPAAGTGAGGSTSTRPGSRRHNLATVTTAIRNRSAAGSSSDGGHSTTRSTQTPLPPRPAWSGSTRVMTPTGNVVAAPTTPSTATTRRARTPSTTGTTPPRLVSKASTTASEDSGIGLYRQLVTADPTLKGT